MPEYDLTLDNSTAQSIKNSFSQLPDEKLADITCDRDKAIRLMQLKVIEILSRHGLTTDFITGHIINPTTKERISGREFGHVRGPTIAPLKNALFRSGLVTKEDGIYSNAELIYFPKKTKKHTSKLQEVYSLIPRPNFTKEPSDD